MAIETAMGGARATAHDDLSKERFPCAVDPYACIARGDPQFVGCLSNGCLFQVHSAQDFCIARLQRAQESLDALADGLHQLTVLFPSIDRARRRLQRPPLCALTPVMIDQCVAKEAIEPCSGGLAVAKHVPALERTDEGLLKDFLSLFSACNSPFEKPEEASVLAG
jgi:hypothetical protein